MSPRLIWAAYQDPISKAHGSGLKDPVSASWEDRACYHQHYTPAQKKLGFHPKGAVPLRSGCGTVW